MDSSHYAQIAGLVEVVGISCAARVCVVGVPVVFAKVFVLAKVLSVFVEAIRLGWGAFFLGEAT